MQTAGEKGPPTRLFKYFPPERLDFLETHFLRFTPPNAFNDPFDASPVMSFHGDPAAPSAADPQSMATRLSSSMQRMADALFNRSQVAQQLLSSKHGVLCLTERRDSLLMWAHYAKEHQGYVVGFRSDHKWLSGMRKVEYARTRPYVAPLDRNWSAPREEVGFYLRKGLDWSYEQEWRMVRPLSKAQKVVQAGDQEVHLWEIPASAIDSVVIGARMPSALRARLVATLSEPFNVRIRVIEAKLSPTSFQLDFARTSRRALRTRNPQIPLRSALPAPLLAQELAGTSGSLQGSPGFPPTRE